MKINYKSYVKAKKCQQSNLTQGKEYGILFIRKDGVYTVLGDDGYRVVERGDTLFEVPENMEPAEVIREKSDRMLNCKIFIGILKENPYLERVDALILQETDTHYYVMFPDKQELSYIEKYHEFLSD